jgi:hypothetical protein
MKKRKKAKDQLGQEDFKTIEAREKYHKAHPEINPIIIGQLDQKDFKGIEALENFHKAHPEMVPLMAQLLEQGKLESGKVTRELTTLIVIGDYPAAIKYLKALI